MDDFLAELNSKTSSMKEAATLRLFLLKYYPTSKPLQLQSHALKAAWLFVDCVDKIWSIKYIGPADRNVEDKHAIFLP